MLEYKEKYSQIPIYHDIKQSLAIEINRIPYNIPFVLSISDNKCFQTPDM